MLETTPEFCWTHQNAVFSQEPLHHGWSEQIRHTKKTTLNFFSYWWWTHIHCSFMLLTWTICPCLLAVHRTQNNLCVLLSFLSAAVRPWRQPFTSKNLSVYCISWALLNMSLLISVKRVSTSSYRADSCFLRCLHCFYMQFFAQFKVCCSDCRIQGQWGYSAWQRRYKVCLHILMGM